MAVTVEQIQNELHIDGEDDLLQSLITEGEDYIRSAVNYRVPITRYEQYPLFDRAVKTYVSSYYYDRSSGVGSNKGLVMMINHLRGRIWGEEDGEDSTTPTQ
ncbi:head-tail connector protein [uncultured Secundilactobacillus sp.]|uniref:head-tail connector protein n=1 Tax=uncultured Secundilactobacillus sp. TaxID=2813935 RepID=UPI00258D5D1A|nr:head-tail connector protein [uncultured Secundilactobacillus sp.]